MSGLHPVDLLAQVLRTLIDRARIDPELVDDVIVGCVSQIGEQSATPGRWAWLAAGLPETVPATTIDRRCGSSQQAADFGAQAVIAGACDIVVAGGVESMSRIPMGSGRQGKDPFGEMITARYPRGLVSQGVAADIVASDFGLSRSQLDEFAVESHARAAECADNGDFDDELISIDIPVDGGGTTTFRRDETIRRGTDINTLSALSSAFRTDELASDWPELGWHTTAGNSSQISDGAAAMLIVEEDTARALGLRPRARFHSFAVASADPIRMLTGPIPATERVLSRAGLRIGDIDHFEINEAFASIPLAWMQRFEADPRLVNPRGGAIALGHPLGASGLRLMATMINALDATGGRYGLQTMCEAGGMANATIIERVAG